ncbi:MAG: Hsp20/alpha crystallin family protein, partial [Bacteroidia bacterium]
LRNDVFNTGFLAPRLLDFGDDFPDIELSAPPANITENNKEFRLDLSAPGLKRDDFNIDIEDGVLTISSEKEKEEKQEDENYMRHEFSYNSFCRTFTLPDNINENNINAKYDNGMLQVTIPKKEVAVSKPKKQIKVS